MTKQVHIAHWKTGAEDVCQSALVLMNSNHNAMAAFCFHLRIEKFLKAIWIKNNQSYTPPRVHNLIYLHDGAKLNLDEESKDFLKIVNSCNQEGFSAPALLPPASSLVVKSNGHQIKIKN